MFRRTRALVAAVVVSVGMTGHAMAHAHLESATPPVNSTVGASPTEIDLFFSEGLELRFTGAKITGAGGVAVPTGEAKLSMQDTAVLVAPVSKPLVAGTYTVEWHALSKDGRKTKGSYTFLVKP
jgi:methionine-rich copper-binding protein CopC